MSGKPGVWIQTEITIRTFNDMLDTYPTIHNKLKMGPTNSVGLGDLFS